MLLSSRKKNSSTAIANGHDALAHARAHRRLRVGDHEEDEELIHGAGDGRDLGLPRIAGDVRAQKRERDKADHVGQRDVEVAWRATRSPSRAPR